MHLIFYDFNFPPHYMQSSSSSRTSWLGVWARRRGRTWRLLWQLHYGLWQVGINSEEDCTVGTLLLYCCGCWWIVGILHFIVAMGHYGLVLLFFWPVVSCLPLTDILYSEKLSREKTFVKFAKVFSVKFGYLASFGRPSEQFVKIFSAKIIFHQSLWKFSPTKVSRYSVLA